jgi:biopolymer transport protein ExbD
MIDIVFLLIIFFLLSSHLARREAQMPMPLPVATTGEEPWDELAPRVILNITADGHVVLAGRPIPQDQLASRLSTARAASEGELEVRIRADRTVPYAHVAPVLLAASQAEIWNVTFAVYSQREVR